MAMLLLRISVTILVFIFIHRVDGLEEENLTSDDYEYYTGKSNGSCQSMLSNQDKFNASSSDNNHNKYQNCFHDELPNLTSNSQINIMASVMLASFISLEGLENVAIIGYDNPTINCNNSGGIYFKKCHNCTIIGIIWEKCGNKNGSKPVIEFHNSSNIVIQNCTFQHSVTQSLAFSEMSGNLVIDSCKFEFNNNFVGHGAVLYYISKLKHDCKFQFTISNCNFIQNGGASDKSIVYISPSSNKSMEQITFANLAFLNNQGVPIYISKQTVFANGTFLFKTNVANEGGGMFITNNSNIIFHNSDVNFTHNIALNNGGALYIQDNSNVTFEESCTLTINSNQAGSGGAFHIFGNSCITFAGNTAATINNNSALKYGGVLYIKYNSEVVFEGNSTVIINDNQARCGGAIYIEDNSNAKFGGNCTVTINNGQAAEDGGALYVFLYSYVIYDGKSNVTLNNNQATYNGSAIYISNNSDVTFAANCLTTISNNKGPVDVSRGAISTWHNSKLTFKGNSFVTIINNEAYRGGGIYIEDRCVVTFEGNSTVKISNNNSSRGGAICIIYSCKVIFEGNTEVIIDNNQALYYSGAIHILLHSDVMYRGNSLVTINHNKAESGGAISISNGSKIIFEGNTKVAISNNQGLLDGGAILIYTHSSVMYKGNCSVRINHNQVEIGGAIYIVAMSNVTFGGNSEVTIADNQATIKGGALYIWKNSDLIFEENSTVSIYNNTAREYGGALYFWYTCNAVFKEDTHVMFYNNVAGYNGGALYVWDNCTITTEGNSATFFNNSKALGDGGAMYININSVIIFQGNSTTAINNSEALGNGGALYMHASSVTTFQGNSTIKFNNNKATYNGGSVYFRQNCTVLLKENTLLTFYRNLAGISGGALYASDNCNFATEGNSTIICNNNNALVDGGAMYIHTYNVITFQGRSAIEYTNNKALGDGGALYNNLNNSVAFQEYSKVKFNDNIAIYFGGALHSKSNIVFERNCLIKFNHNKASQGGAIFNEGDTVFKENSMVQFDNNKANTLGGALHISNLTFNGNTVVIFSNNKAKLNGGALYSGNSSMAMKQNSTILFTNNNAENGGAIFISSSNLSLTDHANVTFNNNAAGQDGGAIHLNDQTNAIFKNSSTITLICNTADNHGGAIYTKITQSTKYFNLSEISFGNNTAERAGNSLYIDVIKTCNKSCFTTRVAGINASDKEIITSPNKMKLHFPAKCISDDITECKKYYINNTMLGQEITIYPCLLDYYNKPAEVTRFRIKGEYHENYFIRSSEYTLVSCNNTIEGVTIVGSKLISLPLNYSIAFTSYAARKSISVNLLVELSPCHPGFQYDRDSQKCECYHKNEIVYCSGSTSTIKRGYWFGTVNGIPTTTFCPINYCNFTCCKTTSGYYELTPARVNQCRSHRSGTACGSCEEGYTLSFDSADCIANTKCTTGQTILVVTLTVIYWFTVIAAVFTIMYYQVGIGYFYAVTYYYSVVDVLLIQHTDLSKGLYIMVTIMSSIAKVTPQFLGHICLLENMSGIDQQFIHYMHPLAVSGTLIIISWLARNSKRLSVFISRGIIRALCFLLLLSYTSVATTSLLLMRSLTFVDVDNIYTYLSPDIQYFHDRHLAYGIIAIIFTLLIVIGLPLLLLLEPFLNAKINFVRIKPLLDQFQGCYKDKYRWFAAYYMICRLIIISIIIANLSEVFISRYVLIILSTVMVLTHLVVRPYVDDVLNIFDGVILNLMVLVTALPLFEYFDTFDSSLVVGIAFVLLILPIVQFIVMKIFISEHNLKVITKKIIKQFCFKNTAAKEDVNVNDIANKVSTTFADLTVDDNMRKNAMICEM